MRNNNNPKYNAKFLQVLLSLTLFLASLSLPLAFGVMDGAPPNGEPDKPVPEKPVKTQSVPDPIPSPNPNPNPEPNPTPAPPPPPIDLQHLPSGSPRILGIPVAMSNVMIEVLGGMAAGAVLNPPLPVPVVDTRKKLTMESFFMDNSFVFRIGPDQSGYFVTDVTLNSNCRIDALTRGTCLQFKSEFPASPPLHGFLPGPDLPIPLFAKGEKPQSVNAPAETQKGDPLELEFKGRAVHRFEIKYSGNQIASIKLMGDNGALVELQFIPPPPPPPVPNNQNNNNNPDRTGGVQSPPRPPDPERLERQRRWIQNQVNRQRTDAIVRAFFRAYGPMAPFVMRQMQLQQIQQQAMIIAQQNWFTLYSLQPPDQQAAMLQGYRTQYLQSYAQWLINTRQMPMLNYLQQNAGAFDRWLLQQQMQWLAQMQQRQQQRNN